MKSIMNAHKSKTIIFSYMLLIFGIIEANIHLIKKFLGDEYYGITFIVVSVVVAVLRTVTTVPLNQK